MPTLKQTLCLLAATLIGCSQATHSPTTAPAPGVTTTVLTPDGRPAAGARAVLVPTGHSVQITDGQTFDDDPTYSRATADSAGHLHLAPTTRPALLAIIHPTGTAFLPDNALSDPPARFRLLPWSRIEGVRKVGPNVAPGRLVIAWADRGNAEPFDPHVPDALYVSSAKSDSTGHYVLDHLPPGDASLAPNDPMSWGPSIERPLIKVHIPKGQTTTADLGGNGRPVEGRITVPSDLAPSSAPRVFHFCMLSPHLPPVPSPLPAELQHQPPSAQAAWWDQFNKTPAAQAYHAAERARNDAIHARTFPFDVRPDGTYHVDDVPPGDYELYLELLAPPVVGAKPTRKVGECKVTLTVPAGDIATPFTAPDAAVAPTAVLNVGDPAPDFTVPGLDDHPLTLSSFRGKYVILQFWATWCGPCVAEMDNVKATHDAFAADPRFALVSLSFDPSPDLPTRYAATHHLDWRHGFLGDMNASPVAKKWGIAGIPSIWLIGPDGRILKKNLRGETLRQELAKALGT